MRKIAISPFGMLLDDGKFFVRQPARLGKNGGSNMPFADVVKQTSDSYLLKLALIAIAVWVTNVWVLDSTAVMTATGTVPH